MRTVSVEEFLTVRADSSLCVFDVRSPREYARGAIPSAHPLPLFDDTERHHIGLAYTEHGSSAAIKMGLNLVGPKLRWFIEEVERYLLPGQSVGVYCWRGGMRSNAIAWLLAFYGFDVLVLRGGYKAFRRWALATFARPHRFIIISGYTGSGKTELLQQLA
ncbi:MAG: rhodanese-like domain-containing protein, partial [Chlorobi bacterium]|nr:rhodanese-like domain-containing protein [Chlorobiota bacterium]